MMIHLADAMRLGYRPPTDAPPPGVPQMRLLSDNECPNSSALWLFAAFDKCPPSYGVTIYGYCSLCWDEGRVPKVWAARVAREQALQ